MTGFVRVRTTDSPATKRTGVVLGPAAKQHSRCSLQRLPAATAEVSKKAVVLLRAATRDGWGGDWHGGSLLSFQFPGHETDF